MGTISNLNNIHLTAEQQTAMDTALKALETSATGVVINLEPKDRRKYGSINETNKLLVNKVYDYYISQPELGSPDIDWAEFAKDYESRAFLEKIINRLQSIVTGMTNAKTLHDYDNYQSALVDYNYVTYKAGTGTPGFEEKKNELGQFFVHTSGETTAKK
ncbi:MAG TPA: hypothetical protein DDZ96_11785 [Porphyromonadaceae bacterium]|jgi:hypothetical protein|nr:hypothetical protein [Porphyromonadaceae bacterium]HBK32441.1 hypothetical protein [Porphyromonadaceae bacterium]HBL34479.1 hypothetical protein [Porphyromonadaceae bacterium]HBX21156.1 hypothetical protein [Porphyromonadaceae bacterium]HCM20876.1 hypothetical protein [Porphyromonadaceae bacterium]